MTASTLYSSSLSIRSGGGRRKFGLCSEVSLYVVRREVWKTGWIFHLEGMRRQKAMQDTTSLTSNRLVCFIWSFFGSFI